MKILLPIVCSLILIGCGDSATHETPATKTPVTTASEPAAQTDLAAEPNATVHESTPAPTATPPAAQTQPQAAPAPKGEKQASQKAETAAPAPVAAAIDGGALYTQKCASCHGQKGEKAALGKSQVIAGWDALKVKEALKGYQAGTYGKEMKVMMQPQAKALSDAQIGALAKHISAL